MTDRDDKFYQNFEFTSNAKRGMPPFMKAQLAKKQATDDDIMQLLSKQDDTVKQRIYNLIRRELQSSAQAI